MNATVTKTIEAYGIEIDVEAEFSYSENQYNEPFEHFGFLGSHPITETEFAGFESGVFPQGDVSSAVDATLLARGWRRNRRFLKRKRKLTRDIETHLEYLAIPSTRRPMG
jgi:hypothetical protein